MSRKIKKQTTGEEFQQTIDLHYLEKANNLVAFLTNFKTTTIVEDNQQMSALLCYFQGENGNRFKCFYKYYPYFYVGYQESAEHEVRAHLETKLAKVYSVQVVEKVDLQDSMHLLGKKKSYFKVTFRTINALVNARNPFKSYLQKRKKKINSDENYYAVNKKKSQIKEILDLITDIREYDVPYHCRVCIDTGLRAGKWFILDIEQTIISKVTISSGKQSMPELKILAYDIETSKAPLKFPDAQFDQVIMISFATQGAAFLIVNGGFCGQEVQNFQYVPKKKPQFRAQVEVFNQPNEKQTLLRFAQYIQAYSPTVITSFNGDKFDYPFIHARCRKNCIDFQKQFGMRAPEQGATTGIGGSMEYTGNFINHLDCFYWVERDAFLPQGSHGLKSVTKSKLNYEPQEMQPEDMVDQAKHSTAKLAEYSVSDAVATYYLYMKHIHGFIFALATIIPMTPDQVLRKGSGTLCENLLMAQAYKRGIIFPNKHVDKFENFYKGHLIDTETYTGGKVECLRTGVYRADFPTQFCLSPKAFQDLINSLDEIIKFSVEHQTEKSIEDILNYEEVKKQITDKLTMLRDVQNPSKYQTLPLIYHVDVASMYPNIILTNRLQPVAVVNDVVCSNCYYNSPENQCKRQLQWEWKGEHFPLNQGQYELLKEKLSQKRTSNTNQKQFQKQLHSQIKKYSQRVYNKVHVSVTEVRTDTVCMRENSFYVDTVRDFRDRRYDYKNDAKVQKGLVEKYRLANDFVKGKEAEMMMSLYQSMQLAHKIILNSFYGYVMRKGSRWYSMETAAMVTYIGGNIIQDSKDFIEKKFGKPLQLDTDGIWLVLPKGFPQTNTIKFKDGKTFKLSYPCQILNHFVSEKYSNPQYQTLNAQGKYDKKRQMSIAFQIDGPYKAMMIPAAKQKQKAQFLDIQQQSSMLLKKRYAVFNFKNQISEFKGFQMKRRGQLNITKIFQEEIFPQYVKGQNLRDCYNHCAIVAKKYIEIINKRGAELQVQQILHYFQQSRVLSRDLDDYGKSKGLAITSARRLADFLGPQVIKGKGICCNFIISATPVDSPVADRAIPTLIFEADIQIQRKYLLKWTKLESLNESIDVRDILDWNYYFERLSTQVQKMICIPAVMQNIPNPIPQIQLPDWLQKKTYDMRHHKQASISSFVFKKSEAINQQKIPEKTPMKEVKQVKVKQVIKSNRNSFSLNKQFPQWLAEQKKIWKNRRRESTSEETVRWSDYKSILQIIPDKSAGNFTVWFHNGGKINQLLLRASRKYYCKGMGDKIKRAPREDGVAFQIQIDQNMFLKQQDYDEVMGKKFYQTKIPLLTSLIIRKGNLWRMGTKSSYEEKQIQQIFGQEYLPGLEKQFLPSVYLVKATVATNRIVWALINPKFDDYHFLFVDKSTNSITKELTKLARKTLGSQQSKIRMQHKNNDQEAAIYINDILQGYLKSFKSPFLVVLSSDNEVNNLQKMGVSFLLDEAPVLSIGQLCFEGVQLLDWKQKSIKNIIRQCENANSEVFSLLNWSRYSHIPICNLPKLQRLDFISNITFSRLLYSGDQITWWNQYNEQLTTTYQSFVYNGRVNNSGLYTSCCLQIDMQNLAVNAIANADELVTLDRQAASMMINKSQKQGSQRIEHLDEMSQAKVAFEYLKKMVKGWVKDIENSQEEANSLLTNIHKWVSSQSNSMFEPLILRMVNELMKKVFYRLIAKLNNLGLEVIFGNFSKIIVASGKYTQAQAQSRVDYILKKCVQQDQKIFQYISLTPQTKFYLVFVFKDSHNYAGILEDNHFFKFQIAELMVKEVGQYLKWLIIYFLKEVRRIGDTILNQFSDNPLQLHKNYQNLLKDRVSQFILSDYKSTVVGLVNQLMCIWAKHKQNYRPNMEPQTIQPIDQQSNDSFIVDDAEGEEKMVETIKQDPKNIQRWIQDNQIDMLIQNLYYILCYDETYKEQLGEVRKSALKEVNLKPSLDYRKIDPKYPKFELPCNECFLVNENPGPCEHCGAQSSSSLELQNSIWKMMQEQGRDLYCNWCKTIKQDYLKKCSCGGKWEFKEHPLEWLPYTNRQSSEWSYVNKVLQFMGLDSLEPVYSVTYCKPQIML